MTSDGETDTRNVVDRYKGWSHEAIVADLDTRRHPFHVAVEKLGLTLCADRPFADEVVDGARFGECLT